MYVFLISSTILIASRLFKPIVIARPPIVIARAFQQRIHWSTRHCEPAKAGEAISLRLAGSLKQIASPSARNDVCTFSAFRLQHYSTNIFPQKHFSLNTWHGAYIYITTTPAKAMEVRCRAPRTARP